MGSHVVDHQGIVHDNQKDADQEEEKYGSDGEQNLNAENPEFQQSAHSNLYDNYSARNFFQSSQNVGAVANESASVQGTAVEGSVIMSSAS